MIMIICAFARGIVGVLNASIMILELWNADTVWMKVAVCKVESNPRNTSVFVLHVTLVTVDSTTSNHSHSHWINYSIGI